MFETRIATWNMSNEKCAVDLPWTSCEFVKKLKLDYFIEKNNVLDMMMLSNFFYCLTMLEGGQFIQFSLFDHLSTAWQPVRYCQCIKFLSWAMKITHPALLPVTPSDRQKQTLSTPTDKKSNLIKMVKGVHYTYVSGSTSHGYCPKSFSHRHIHLFVYVLNCSVQLHLCLPWAVWIPKTLKSFTFKIKRVCTNQNPTQQCGNG